MSRILFSSVGPVLAVVSCGLPAQPDEPFDWGENGELWDGANDPGQGSLGAGSVTLLILDIEADADFATTGLATLSAVGVNAQNRRPIRPEGLRMQACAGGPPSSCGEVGTPLEASWDDTVPPRRRDSGLPFAIGILLDSSGSMSSNDPNRLRVDGARQYVDIITEIAPASQFSVADFGAGSSIGFGHTRLLSDFTSDRDTIDEAIDQTVASGGTPLYESVDEYLEWIDGEVSGSSAERAALLLSDGQPNSDAARPDAIDRALDLNIPINTVALTTGNVALSRTMRGIARETMGVFAVATEADDLNTAFEAIAVGNENGYGLYRIAFPDGSRPTQPVEIFFSAGGPASSVIFDPIR